jgi:uncharacterized protein
MPAGCALEVEPMSVGRPRSLWPVALVGVVALTGRLAAQQAAFAGLYRMYQAGAEVGRERFVRLPGAAEMSVVVPLLALKLDSRTEFDSAGGFVRFDAQAYNAAGDTLRGRYTVTVDGDTLRTIARPTHGDSVVKLVRGPAAGVIPAQSVAVVPLLARRFPRDTVVRMLPMGGDSTIPVTVRHQGDSAVVSFLGIEASTTLPGGAPGDVDVPRSQVHAALWNGRDSLPPLAGLRRPVPDYTVPPGAPYTADDVRIPIRSVAGDTFSLAGTFTRPVHDRTVPVVVTITGSGQQTRDEDLWPLLPDYRPFRQIADRLGRAGIGVLRLDDRAVGGSTGSVGTTADYADDVRQVVAWLRRRPDVAGGKIALLGHSEGGAIAPLVAAQDPKLAGIVLLAGPGKPGRAILTDQLTRPIETAPGLTDSLRAAELAQVPSHIDQLAQSSPWMKWFLDYDPLATARRVRVPVLVLQGALDRQVSAGQADTLAAALRAAGNRDVTEKVYPGLNHLFLRTSGDGSPSEYPGLKDANIPDAVLDDIATWLATRLH